MIEEQATGRVFAALGKARLVPLDDLGFASSEGAKLVQKAKSIAEAEAHHKLADVVIGRFANMQHLVNQSVEQDGGKRPVGVERSDLTAGYRKGIVAYRAIERIGCDDMCQHELLQSVDAVLQFLELVLIERSHGGESPDVVAPDFPKPTPPAPHRLSERD